MIQVLFLVLSFFLSIDSSATSLDIKSLGIKFAVVSTSNIVKISESHIMGWRDNAIWGAYDTKLDLRRVVEFLNESDSENMDISRFLSILGCCKVNIVLSENQESLFKTINLDFFDKTFKQFPQQVQKQLNKDIKEHKKYLNGREDQKVVIAKKLVLLGVVSVSWKDMMSMLTTIGEKAEGGTVLTKQYSLEQALLILHMKPKIPLMWGKPGLSEQLVYAQYIAGAMATVLKKRGMLKPDFKLEYTGTGTLGDITQRAIRPLLEGYLDKVNL